MKKPRPFASHRLRIVALLAVAAGLLVIIWWYHNPAAETSPATLSAQIAQGKSIYVENCLVCHGVRGVGGKNWQQKQPDGSYPPPPLNGTAHTWHHSLRVLYQQIQQGSVQRGGQMPGFRDKLSPQEVDAVIAYIIDLWPPQIKRAWENQIKNN